METESGSGQSWKGIRDAGSACELIDRSVLLQWKDMRSLKRELSEFDQVRIMQHFARMLCANSQNRLYAEIVMESILIWISYSVKESQVLAFFDQLFAEEGHDQASRIFAEVALTSEVTDHDHDEILYSTGVAITCELGLAIRRREATEPGTFRNAREVADHITTYLLSVSNSSNNCIRLSLLHYFGRICSGMQDKSSFNRIMNRFGHTVLDHLFSSLFHKKSEAISLQYLLENLPYIFESEAHCQKILHETFKYYMLKKPDRFSLFIQTLSEKISEDPKYDGHEVRKVLLQHLAALFKVVAEVNHKLLAGDILVAMKHFNKEPYLQQLTEQLMITPGIRPAFREFLKHLGQNNSGRFSEHIIAHLRSPKRGRKPSFSRAENIGTLEQVSFLGSFDLAKAS
ncbi:MAG: hypothetical protein H6618_05780 [Deltaproteobacteria bacterium]|nr:hypothetical protein [Deltaproteobacteria bacterium]